MSPVRDSLYHFLIALNRAPDDSLPSLLSDRVASNATWRVAHPVNDLVGPEQILSGLVQPLRRALPGALRRDDIFMGGVSRTGSGGWVAALGNYVGNFVQPLFGITPDEHLVFLRYGEFYRLEGDQIVEAVILLDLLDLLRQVGRMPLPKQLGTEMLFPAPATHDGVLPAAPERSDASADLVEAMLRDLHAYDLSTFQSPGQTGPDGYWREDMLWFGPAGIGSNFTYPGFDKDHRIAFLTAFPDRKGGNHFARFGDGDYVCSGGWPSMTATHSGPYLGVQATDKPVTVRVMDFWRVASGQIAENWVLIDMIDLFMQMGVDLLANAEELA
ncbi:MAG: ester cyclase [Pseudomonadota bacterium]